MNDTNLDGYRRWAAEPLTVPPRFSIVIPAYNESFRIVPTIGAIATHVSTLGEPWELIVADDGSTDDTVELVEDLQLANCQVLVAEKNGGKGSAVRRGIFASRGDIVLFADADQSTPIEHFGDLLAEIEAGHDVVVGSRAADGADVANKSKVRDLFSWGLKTVQRVAFAIPVSDTQCGFKMFTADAADLLFKRQVVDEFSFDLEILWLAQRFDLSVAEVPVSWIDAPGSTVDAVQVAREFVRDMIAIRRNARRGVYETDNHQRPTPEDPPTALLDQAA